MTKIEVLYQSIIQCGFMTNYMAEKYINLSSTRLNLLEKENYLTSSNHMLFGKTTKIYLLTDKTKKEYILKGYRIYKTDFNQLEHDYVLLHTYLTLPHQVKSTWINESALKFKYPNSVATTDAMFSINDKNIAVEIITSNYTKSTIENKLDFSTTYADDRILLHTSNIKY